jgi:hypothetical protein
MTHTFNELTVYEHDDVAAALARDIPEELQCVAVAVALADDDYRYSVELCLRLARHIDPTVVGNALLGFGHIARRFGRLPSEARQLVEAGLASTDLHVRSQAESAADDIASFAASGD